MMKVWSFRRCNSHVVLGTVIYVILGVTVNQPVQSFRYEDVLES